MIQELIDDALRSGVDIYDHVANCMDVTRERAKALCYCYLFGGEGNTATAGIVDKIYDKYPFFNKWRDKVSSETIKVFDPLTGDDAWQPAARVQAEDRMNRVRRFIIKVTNDGNPDYRLYSILSTNETDARMIAFAMDGGFSPQTDSYMEQGHIELAITWTEVMI
jgi:hypothetical protein